MPVKLALQALKLGTQLVSSPAAGVPAAVAAKREAGYILLGAVAAVLPQKALTGRAVADLLGSWKPALHTSTAELDVTKYLPVGCATHCRHSYLRISWPGRT